MFDFIFGFLYKKIRENITLIPLIFLLLIVCIFVWIYNRIVKLKNLVIEAKRGIDAQLKRRYDLVPNLVKVESFYCKHESQILKDVIKLRSDAMKINDLNQKEQFENKLEQSLCSILVLKESYPDLKADKVFFDLQHARRYYNGVVRNYNTFINFFPICCLKHFLNANDYNFF